MSVPIVKVKQGRIKGISAKNIDGGEYFAFRSIPYAEPPIGDLRFKDPRPPKDWNGICDVGEVSPPSAQPSLMLDSVAGAEDCLYLSVATNSLILNEKRAVMVWFHGGGFQDGSIHEEYRPDYLVKCDIIFVGVTYRLGAFGFLNLDLPDCPGNQGLKDQIAALRWIKENIDAFGGDPDNITIFGQSAGAVSAHYLALSPLARGLFHKVIAQSGSAMNPWSYQKKPVACGLRLAELTNKKTNDTDEALKHLMTLSTWEIIEAQMRMSTPSMGFQAFFIFVPSDDRKSLEPFIPEPPNEMVKRGINVPLLIGFLADEGVGLMLSSKMNDLFDSINYDFAANLARDLRVDGVERITSVANAVRKFYFGEGVITFEKHKHQYAQLKGDINFVNGVQEIVDIQIGKSTPTYLYRFSYRASYPTLRTLMKSEVEGCCHCDELGALFHSNLYMPGKTHEKGTTDRLVMKRMTRLWTNFAKTGNPTPEMDTLISCKWEPVTKAKRNYMEIDSELTMGENAGQTAWNLWKRLLGSVKTGQT